mmetsp:Transcript_9912/g.18642  ORF Transcript_9912/g.18642 Transcript_9912/m.18642 type:complete len:290 (+) Transcript_9912:210-1079(+)
MAFAEKGPNCWLLDSGLVASAEVHVRLARGEAHPTTLPVPVPASWAPAAASYDLGRRIAAWTLRKDSNLAPLNSESSGLVNTSSACDNVRALPSTPVPKGRCKCWRATADTLHPCATSSRTSFLCAGRSVAAACAAEGESTRSRFIPRPEFVDAEGDADGEGDCPGEVAGRRSRRGVNCTASLSKCNSSRAAPVHRARRGVSDGAGAQALECGGDGVELRSRASRLPCSVFGTFASTGDEHGMATRDRTVMSISDGFMVSSTPASRSLVDCSLSWCAEVALKVSSGDPR